MIHGVSDLVRREADVHRVQHGTNHGYREEALEGAMAVPI